MIKPIPTKHRGITFRSRTEARWAEFFHLAHVPSQYEPEGYDLGGDWYVPDFLLTFARIFFEVKPDVPTEREVRVATALAQQSRRLVVIAMGAPHPEVNLRAFSPSGRDMACFLVNEHEGGGAWIVESTYGGGWVKPLSEGLKNPGFYTCQHDDLARAGDLQFNKPKSPDDDLSRRMFPRASRRLQ